MFEFFTAQALSARDFDNAETQWAYEGLLAKQAITTIYAKSGTGKSYLALAITGAIAANMRMAGYVDYENRVGELERRGVNRLIAANPQFFYLHKTKMRTGRHDLLSEMAKLAKSGYYRDALIVLDGAKHFVRDVQNDRQAREMI
ncbi:MAG: AAA family ATPase [Helicobacteraceae bacterium]|nr:AAA family ATPase [Helicobacteraceae bacterium]